MTFPDRTTAGRALAEHLDDVVTPSSIIVALSRGGVAVALPVSERFGVPLAVTYVSTLTAPSAPQLALGAIAWLGEHKTVIGFGAGVVAAVVAAGIQSRLPWAPPAGSIKDPLAHGLRLGLGAMLGDTIKSFVKRRVGIPAGAPWVPFDQLDFVLGALALGRRRIRPSAPDVLAIAALSMAGHVAVNHVAHYLGIRDTRW
jgi:CDP-2,3-bis-(O-geranylgeranyl)-sn-glycerol synthase